MVTLGANWITDPTLLPTGIFDSSVAVKMVVVPISVISSFFAPDETTTVCSEALKEISAFWLIRTSTSLYVLTTFPPSTN